MCYAIKDESDDAPSEEHEVDPDTFLNSLVNHNKSALIALIKYIYYDQLKSNEEQEKFESIFRTSVTPPCTYTCKCIDCSSYCGDSFSYIKSTQSDSISLMVRKERSTCSEETEMSKMKREVSETKILVEKVHEVLEGLSN